MSRERRFRWSFNVVAYEGGNPTLNVEKREGELLQFVPGPLGPMGMMLMADGTVQSVHHEFLVVVDSMKNFEGRS